MNLQVQVHLENRKKRGIGKGERKCCFPHQLSIQRGGGEFDMVDLNTFSIISKQEASPAAVFWQRRGRIPACNVMDKCYPPCLPLIPDLKTKIDITNVL